jgi:hypothetical protein
LTTTSNVATLKPLPMNWKSMGATNRCKVWVGGKYNYTSWYEN